MQNSFIKFLKGFGYAWEGIEVAIRERNMRVHIMAAILVASAGWYFQLAAWEWAVIILMCGAVMAAEVVNTALEDMCNSMRDVLGVKYTGTKTARDLAAGSVLILAVTSVLLGILVFWPHVALLLNH